MSGFRPYLSRNRYFPLERVHHATKYYTITNSVLYVDKAEYS